jgi:hypothetical protein
MYTFEQIYPENYIELVLVRGYQQRLPFLLLEDDNRNVYITLAVTADTMAVS